MILLGRSEESVGILILTGWGGGDYKQHYIFITDVYKKRAFVYINNI